MFTIQTISGPQRRAWVHANSHDFWQHAKVGDYLYLDPARGWRQIYTLQPISRTVVTIEIGAPLP